jgi:hypothetical protein
VAELILVRRMADRREIQSIVYMIAGVGLGGLILYSMLLVLYGVPPHPLQFVGLACCLTLFAGGALSLSNPQKGRIVALCALIGVTPLWLGSVISLVPQHNLTISPYTCLVVLAYFALIGFALCYPRPFRFSMLALVLVAFFAGATALATYLRRVRAGEYDRPGIACFLWHADSSNPVVVARDPLGWIDPKVRTLLDRAGIHGSIEWTGSSGELRDSNRMIVLAQTKPPHDTQLYHPREGLVLYTFDGKSWIKTPSDAPTYSLFATLENEGSDTLLFEPCGNSKQGSTAFTWR